MYASMPLLNIHEEKGNSRESARRLGSRVRLLLRNLLKIATELKKENNQDLL